MGPPAIASGPNGHRPEPLANSTGDNSALANSALSIGAVSQQSSHSPHSSVCSLSPHSYSPPLCPLCPLCPLPPPAKSLQRRSLSPHRRPPPLPVVPSPLQSSTMTTMTSDVNN